MPLRTSDTSPSEERSDRQQQPIAAPGVCLTSTFGDRKVSNAYGGGVARATPS